MIGPERPAAVFEAALARLCEALAGAVTCTWTGERLRIAAADGTLPLVVTCGDAIEVELDGWSKAFPIDSGEADDDDAEVEAALDLIGAALFGEVRLVIDSA